MPKPKGRGKRAQGETLNIDFGQDSSQPPSSQQGYASSSLNQFTRLQPEPSPFGHFEEKKEPVRKVVNTTKKAVQPQDKSVEEQKSVGQRPAQVYRKKTGNGQQEEP